MVTNLYSAAAIECRHMTDKRILHCNNYKWRYKEHRLLSRFSYGVFN